MKALHVPLICFIALVITTSLSEADLLRMWAVRADSASVSNAKVLTLSYGARYPLECIVKCMSTSFCMVIAHQPPNCLLVDGTLLTSPLANKPSLSVYFKIPAGVLYNGNITLQEAIVMSMLPSWTIWTPWTYCPVSCGGGTQSRNRTLMCTAVNGTTTTCPSNVAGPNNTVGFATRMCHNFTCSCRTDNTGDVKNASCIFPYTYNWANTTYPVCTTSGQASTGNWCPTGGLVNGTYNSGTQQWGNCNPNCPRCLTVDGPYVGVDCYLPFKFNGTWYYKCITMDNGFNEGQPWCGTGTNYQWGICDDARLCAGGF